MEGSRSTAQQAPASVSIASRAMAFMRASKLFRFLLLVCVIAVITLAYVTNYSDVRGNILPSSPSYLEEESGPVVLDAERGFVVANRTMQMEGGAAHTLHDLYIKAKDRAEGKGLRSEVGMRIPVGGPMWRNLKSLIKKAESESFPWTPSKERNVDCSKLLAGDREELNRTNRLLIDVSLSESTIGEMAAVCPQFRQRLGFITSPLTEEERDFPIAFSILTFKDAEQVLNLLRAIYRPQNFYCIHVDKKSSKEYRDAIVAISKCFDNVFLASRSVDVRWGEFSVLEPELVCMEDLWRHKAWKYFINLTGQEFPLRTNLELVRILKAFNGANSLEGTRKRSNPGRWESAGKPPGGIEPVKGSVHVTVNRDFVDFVLHNETGQAFLNWSRHVVVPDETFFSSLNHNPHLGIRGAYIGEAETDPVTYPFITRFKNWGGHPFNYPCAGGKRVRMICILSTGDLPLLNKRPELFANKFYPDYSRLALGCLAERIYNHTRDEFLGNMDFDVSYYANLPFVKNRVITSTFNRTL